MLHRFMIGMASLGILLALTLQVTYILSNKKPGTPIQRFSNLSTAIAELGKNNISKGNVRFTIVGNTEIFVYESGKNAIHTEQFTLVISPRNQLR